MSTSSSQTGGWSLELRDIGERCVKQGLSALLISDLLQKPISEVETELDFPEKNSFKKPEGHSPLLFQDWRCDSCGEPIAKLIDANVCWHNDAESMKKRGFKIVHGTCPDSSPGFLSLSELVGYRGLSYLLGMLSDGRIEKMRGRRDRCEVEDLEGFVDLLRRLFVPNYEAARQCFSNEDIENEVGGDTTRYSPDYLRAIIQLGNSSHE